MVFRFSNQYQLAVYDWVSGWYHIYITHGHDTYELHIRRDLERMIIEGRPPTDGCILIYNTDAGSFAYFIKHSRRIPAVAFMISGTEPSEVQYISDYRSYDEYLTLAK